MNLHIYMLTLKHSNLNLVKKRLWKFLWGKKILAKKKKKKGNKEIIKEWKCEIGLTFNTDSEKTKYYIIIFLNPRLLTSRFQTDSCDPRVGFKLPSHESKNSYQCPLFLGFDNVYFVGSKKVGSTEKYISKFYYSNSAKIVSWCSSYKSNFVAFICVGSS